MGHQITKLWRQHKSEYYEFQQYNQADKSLKSLLIGEVDEDYIRYLMENKLATQMWQQSQF